MPIWAWKTLRVVLSVVGAYAIAQASLIAIVNMSEGTFDPGLGMAIWIAIFLPTALFLLVRLRLGPSAQNGSVADELEKLSRLRDAGTLTEEEFGREKARLLR